MVLFSATDLGRAGGLLKAASMPISFEGTVANSLSVPEVESNTNAIRSRIMYDSYAHDGHYLSGEQRGNMNAGLAAGSPIVSFRFGGGVCLVRKILFDMGSNNVGFTAGTAQFDLFVARSFSASDTGGSSMFAGGDEQKLRSSMGTSQVLDYRSSVNSTLTAGTRTLDAQQLSTISVPISTAVATMFVPLGTRLFHQDLGAYPLVLSANEGFVIQATVPATGTWTYSVHTYWEELPSY